MQYTSSGGGVRRRITHLQRKNLERGKKCRPTCKQARGVHRTAEIMPWSRTSVAVTIIIVAPDVYVLNGYGRYEAWGDVMLPKVSSRDFSALAVYQVRAKKHSYRKLFVKKCRSFQNPRFSRPLTSKIPTESSARRLQCSHRQKLGRARHCCCILLRLHRSFNLSIGLAEASCPEAGGLTRDQTPLLR